MTKPALGSRQCIILLHIHIHHLLADWIYSGFNISGHLIQPLKGLFPDRMRQQMLIGVRMVYVSVNHVFGLVKFRPGRFSFTSIQLGKQVL